MKVKLLFSLSQTFIFTFTPEMFKEADPANKRSFMCQQCATRCTSCVAHAENCTGCDKGKDILYNFL